MLLLLIYFQRISQNFVSFVVQEDLFPNSAYDAAVACSSSWLDFKFIPLLKSYIVLQNPEKSYDFKLGQNLASLFCIHTYAFNYYIAVSRYVFTIP